MPYNIVRGILLLTGPLQSPPVSDHPRQSGLQAGVLLTENNLLPAVLAFKRPLDDLTDCPPRSVSRRLLADKARWAACWSLVVVKFIRHGNIA